MPVVEVDTDVDELIVFDGQVIGRGVGDITNAPGGIFDRVVLERCPHEAMGDGDAVAALAVQAVAGHEYMIERAFVETRQ